MAKPQNQPPIDGAADNNTEGGPPPPAPPAGTGAPASAEAPAPKAFPYTVAHGNAFPTPRGVLVGGDEITVADCNGGQAAIDKLVTLQRVIKRA